MRRIYLTIISVLFLLCCFSNSFSLDLDSVLPAEKITNEVIEAVFEKLGEAEIQKSGSVYVKCFDRSFFITPEKETALIFEDYILCKSNISESEKRNFILKEIIHLPLAIFIDDDGDIKLIYMVTLEGGLSLKQLALHAKFAAATFKFAEDFAEKQGIVK